MGMAETRKAVAFVSLPNTDVIVWMFYHCETSRNALAVPYAL